MRTYAAQAKSLFLFLSVVGCASPPRAGIPRADGQRSVDNGAGAQGACETQVGAHTNDFGCYLITEAPLDPAPPGPIFWHLYSFPTRSVAEAAKTTSGTVLESFGKIWLMTLAEESWRSGSGDFVGRVGPLPLNPGAAYTVRYMEARFGPGMHTRVHRHAGPEAWYVLTGTQCLETPEGAMVVRAGEGSVVREGPPMMLSSVGPDLRTALVLVVYDSKRPWSVAANDWVPKGVCPKG